MINEKKKILMPSKKAFTLAEVLITLGIIGVVAAMTIPTLITNNQQRSMDTAANVFNRKFGEALKIMNAQSSLAGFTTTRDFVDELSKHIKIVKICDSNELTNCFVSEINTSEDPIDTSQLKTASNLNSSKNYGTETIGVQFADGVTALIAYNPDATQDPFSTQVVRITNSGESVGFATDAISILYDVSGGKSPNQMDTSKDIRGVNVAIKTGINIEVLTGGPYYFNDAVAACESKGMRLPDIGSYKSYGYGCSADAAANTLCGLYNNRESLNLTFSGWVWSNSLSHVVDFAYDLVTNAAIHDTADVICISD